MKLAGKVALVTGAGTGIGRSVALALSEHGVIVGLLGRRRPPLDAVRGEIESAGGVAAPLVADVTNPREVEAAVAKLVETAAAPTLLINNAGSGKSAPLKSMPDELWHDIIAVNLTGVYVVTRRVLPLMLDLGVGRIVNVASVAGLRGYPYITAYCAAKHGVVGFTRALAREVAAKGITVNAVCPGYVDTPMTQETFRSIADKTGCSIEEARVQIEKLSPQGRIFSPEEVAATIVYLCTVEAAGVNGQAIPICGGEMT